MLKSALMGLLKTKTIDKITIYELCDTAQINRTTFYKYYGSQYDLLAEIQDEMFAEMNEKLGEYKGTDNGISSLCNVLELTTQEQFITLINTVPDREFTEKLFALPTIRALLGSQISSSFESPQKEYAYTFYCHGGYAIIRSWLNKENREEPEVIARLIFDLIL